MHIGSTSRRAPILERLDDLLDFVGELVGDLVGWLFGAIVILAILGFIALVVVAIAIWAWGVVSGG